MLSRIDRLAYHSQHLSFLINATVMEEAARLVTRKPRPTMDHAVWKCLQTPPQRAASPRSANVEAGLYPRELLFDFPVRRYMREFPRLMPMRRASCGACARTNFKDIPARRKERFPPYYRRTFHWQTDGYFSEHSAEVYELGVELLFRGTADVMRRQVIPPITRLVRETRRRRQVKLLDIGCGTGRTLHQIARTHPTMRLHGADLSPAYIKLARKRLERCRGADARGRERRSAAVGRRDVRRRHEHVHVPRAAAQCAPQRRARDVPRRAARAASS